MGVREVVTRALFSMPCLAQMKEETTKIQVGKLSKVIKQLQERVEDMELKTVPSTPQEVQD